MARAIQPGEGAFETMSQGDEAIRHIRRALWGRPSSPGASVMVGAGFSLTARPQHADAPRFLLWRELLTELERQLGYTSSSGRGTSDALRLASEFESAHGTPALEQFIRQSVPDEHYTPGPLHSLLVSLPWADIFTTNYDRLIERAVPQAPETRYSVVKSIPDISIASRPRIVKLHGSFPGDRPFILTEEHYRTYPQKFVAFVNLVQQAVMETTFCLIGFSGDDPNFLQWSGWVRDTLGAAAPPIYLCGVLDLAPQQQHILRARHIIPVDLGPSFPRSTYPNSDLRHAHALEWFLLSLQAGAPPDLTRWPDPPPAPPQPSSPGLPPILEPDTVFTAPMSISNQLHDSFTGRDASLLAASWYRDRLLHPGWITLPETNRASLWSATSRWIYEPGSERWRAAMHELPPAVALLCWYELAWRLEQSLVPLIRAQAEEIIALLEQFNPYPHLIEGLRDACTPADSLPSMAEWTASGPALNWDNLSSTWIALAFMILRNAREEFDGGVFSTWAARLERAIALRSPWNDRYHYERAMYHLSRLEQGALRRVLSAWTPHPSDAFHQGRRAALLAELGELEAARASVDAALQLIQSNVPGRGKLRTLSEEGWLVWLANLLDDPDRGPAREVLRSRSAERRRRLEWLSHLKCDPRDQITTRQYKLREETLARIEHSRPREVFDPGRISRWHSFRNVEPHDWFFVRTFEMGAAFPRAPHLKVFPQGLAEAAKSLFESDWKFALALMLRVGDVKLIEGMFDRITVALLPVPFIDHVFDWGVPALREAAELTAKGPTPHTNDLSARLLSPLSELLSRLWFRFRGDQLVQARGLLVELHASGAFLRDRWELPRKLHTLFHRAFYEMSADELARWLPELLMLEIPEGGDADNGYGELPEVFDEIELPHGYRLSPEHVTPALSAAITSLLRRAHGEGEGRARAISRIAVLHAVGGLNEAETREFARAVWSRCDSRGIPLDTGYRIHGLLRLPAPEDVRHLEIIKSALLEMPLRSVFVEMDGEIPTSSKPVKEAADILECMEAASVGQLALRRHGGRIEWTPAECKDILTRLSSWVSTNITERNRSNDILDPLRDSLCAFLTCTVLPLVASDPAMVATIVSVVRGVGPAGRTPLDALPLELVAGHMAEIQLQEALLAPLHGLSEASEDEVRRAGSAVLLWLSYARRGLTPPPPRTLVPDVVNSLVGQRISALGRVVELVALLIELFPEHVEDRSLSLVERTLQSLLQVTALPATTPRDSSARVEARLRLDLRATTARLAYQLARYYASRSRPLPPVLEEWKRLAQSDVLPEVRRAWSA